MRDKHKRNVAVVVVLSRNRDPAHRAMMRRVADQDPADPAAFRVAPARPNSLALRAMGTHFASGLHISARTLATTWMDTS